MLPVPAASPLVLRQCIHIAINHINWLSDILCSVTLERRLVFMCLVVNETGPFHERERINLQEEQPLFLYMFLSASN
jgi:hypothetical protein